jgi:hypothetical protein
MNVHIIAYISKTDVSRNKKMRDWFLRTMPARQKKNVSMINDIRRLPQEVFNIIGRGRGNLLTS